MFCCGKVAGTCPEGGRAHGRPALAVSGRVRRWCQGLCAVPRLCLGPRSRSSSRNTNNSGTLLS